MFWNSQVLVCGGPFNTLCFLYDIKANNWSSIPSILTREHFNFRGSTYQEKIYLADNLHPEVIDPASNSVLSWPVVPIPGEYGCMVTWNDSFIYLGGQPNFNVVLRYSHVTKNWTTLSTSTPMQIGQSSCVVLPNQNILVAGSALSPDYKTYAVYNVSSNSWPKTTTGFDVHYQSTSVVLSNRVFTIPTSNVVEEYNYNNNTVTVQPFRLATTRTNMPSAIALPAKMFSHLPGGCKGVM